jgi:SAM-dependent methyltransferase
MYEPEFFSRHHAPAERSARRVLPLVIALLHPGSVVDVGCGSGAWLAEAARLGVDDYLGIDGHTPAGSLGIPTERFLTHDLATPLRLERRFDLVMCLEVGEHLEPDGAEVLVDSLVRLGPAVLFSAAVPHQGGDHHVNEQWPDYWAELFAARGFLAIDAIRPSIWRDDEVNWWYRQNVLLLCEGELVERHAALRDARAATRDEQLAVVHPHLHLSAASERNRLAEELARSPSLRELLRKLPPTAAAAARRRLTRGTGRGLHETRE